MLASRAKRYLSKPEHRIQLEDLVSEEVERVISRLDQDNISLNPPTDDKDKLRRILLCEGISEGLAKVCGLIGRWGNSSQVSIAADVIRAILSFANANTGERQIYLELREYPAVLAYHTCTLGLQYSKNWSELHKFMGHAVPITDGRPGLLLNVVGPSSWTGFGTAIWQEPGKEERYTPFNDHLAGEIFAPTASNPPPCTYARKIWMDRQMFRREAGCDHRQQTSQRSSAEPSRQAQRKRGSGNNLAHQLSSG